MNDETPPPADDNVERLIHESYRPDAIDHGFAQRTLARLERLSAERRLLADPKKRILWLAFANAAAILMLIVVPPLFWQLFSDHPDQDNQTKTAPGTASPADRLTPKARTTPKPPVKIEAGKTISTAAGEKKKLALPDDGLVSLNQNTRIRIDNADKLTLLDGEIFLEVAPARKEPFVIATPKRLLNALVCRLDVKAGESGTSVLVTQGEAKVDGVADAIHSGQVLAANSDTAAPALRASHELEWTRDLLAEEQLVPPSDYCGGALTARGADGQDMRLSLRRYHVDVHIEDGFARTTIDQTYFNHNWGRLEGTFHFPLPADASLSRLAMYVDGTRMEGGMVERENGRAIFDSIVRTQRDPALLEWVDGTTFKMRVFPLEPRQEKRILLSYTQKLPVLYGRTTYRFPSGHSLDKVGEWSLNVRVKNGEKLTWKSPNQTLIARAEKGDLLLGASASKVKLDRDVVVELKDPAFTGGEQARFVTTDYLGQRYLMLRYRPELQESQSGKRQTRDWVILFELSAERDPLLARAQIELVRALLLNAEPDDTFTLLTAGSRIANLTPTPRTATPANVKAAVAELEKVHLIGGLDLAAGLKEAARALRQAKNPHLLHIGSGLPRLGERREEKLVALLPEKTRYLAIGVGKRWNRAFMKRAAEKTGGLFAQVNPDETLSWRAFDILATLNTPRLLDLRVGDAQKKLTFLTDTTQLAQGEELCAVTRTIIAEKDWPASVIVTGTLDGKPYRRELKIAELGREAGYVPRTWGRLEIDRLVAEGAKTNRTAIVELSQSLYVMSPFTSLLVLETEEMYKRFKVDRGRKDHWAMYDSPEKIEVYHEPIDGPRVLIHPGKPAVMPNRKPNVEQVRRSIIVRALKPAHRFRDDFNPFASGRDPLENLYREIILTNVDEGIQPEIRFENRIFDVSVLRSVDPNDAVGIAGVNDGVPLSLPVPPGSEVRVSQQGWGKWPGFAEIDGFRGIRNIPAGFAGRQARFFSQTDWRVSDDRGAENGSMGWEERDFEIDATLGEFWPRSLALASAVFADLTLYAPGLNTSAADVQAVLEAEADSTSASARGRVADRVRTLIEKARAAGWRKITIPASKTHEAFTITFDGTGRYRWERTLAMGLREIVVCDGTTLMHLYPEIGLAAKRTVSRFHRAAFSALVPNVLPPVDDLAAGADIEMLGENTVVILPHQGQHVVHLVFDRDGKLIEKKRIDRSKQKVLDQRKVEETTATTEPDLMPDLRELVVLPMPWRTLDHVRALPRRNDKGAAEENAVQMLAAYFAAEPWQLPSVIKHSFLERGDRRPGLFTLLVAAGHQLDAVLAPGEKLEGNLVHYLERASGRSNEGTRLKANDFLSRMTLLHELRGLASKADSIDERKEAELREAIRSCKSPVLLWTLTHAFSVAEPNRFTCNMLEELSKGLRDVPELGFAAEYERATALYRGDQKQTAKKVFLALHERTLAADRFLPLGGAFRDAVGPDAWRDVIRRSANHWLKQKNAHAVIALAEVCDHLGSDALVGELMDSLVASGVGGAKILLTAGAFLCHAKRYSNAEALATRLIDKPETASDPECWRLAARVAVLQDRPARAASFLEKALDLEWQNRPTTFDLRIVRRDYENLLGHYIRLAHAAGELEQIPPDGLAARALQLIERWRTLDPNGTAVEQSVDAMLVLGEREWAWDYLTTLLANETTTSETWSQRAEKLREMREHVLAERALEQAQALEPENAKLLLDQAIVRREAGRPQAARELLRRLVHEKWPADQSGTVKQARQLLGE
jgi:Tfp pilus assembly protein PilF